MSNWYKQYIKIASVSFYIEGTEKIAQPMGLLDICNDITKFIYHTKDVKGLRFTYDTISPDTSSSDFDAPTGIINFYLTDPKIDINFVKEIIQNYNKIKYPFIKIDIMKQEQSNSYVYQVVRLNVIENRTKEYEYVPEFNIANDNFHALIELLHQYGLNIDTNEYTGSIDVNDLQKILSSLGTDDYLLEPFASEPSKEKGDKGMTMIDFGRSKEQLRSYLEMLKKMIDYIKKNNLPNGKIIFA